MSRVRGKVKLAFIVNNTARKVSFNKRKKSFLKKLEELSTLCGVDAFAVIYDTWQPNPKVHPSHEDINQMLERLAKMSELDKTKNTLDMQSLLSQRIDKAGQQLNRLRMQNREKDVTRVMFEALFSLEVLQGLGVAELNDLSWVIDQYMVNVKRQIEKLTENRPKDEEVVERAQAEAEPPKAMDMDIDTDMNIDMDMDDQLFMDMMLTIQDDLDPKK